MSNPIVTQQTVTIGFTVDPAIVNAQVTHMGIQVLLSVAAGLDNIVRSTQTVYEVLVSASPAKAPSVNLIQHGWNPDLDIPPELTTDLQP